MIQGHAKSFTKLHKKISTSLKIASDGGCQLLNDKKGTVSKQLNDAGDLAHVPLEGAKLLMGLVGRNISNYLLIGKISPTSPRRNHSPHSSWLPKHNKLRLPAHVWCSLSHS